jgi:hypothetical protein
MLGDLEGQTAPNGHGASAGSHDGGPLAWPDLDLEVLRAALRDEVDGGRRRVERLMGLTAAPQGTTWVMSALADTDESRRSAAIELIEVALGRQLGRLVLTVLDPVLDDHERSLALAGLTPDAAEEPDLVPWLVALVEDADGAWADPWLRASALRILPRLDPDAAVAAARSLVDEPDVVLAETVAWVLSRDASSLR